jgi:hypothetical protein
MVQRIPDLPYGHVPTCIELLAPDSPALRILAARSAPPGVHYHSVIGVEPERWQLPWHAQAGDGVVPYNSAHLEGVESELVVPASHTTVHQHPETVKEIRRILMAHLATLASVEPERGSATRTDRQPAASGHGWQDQSVWKACFGSQDRLGDSIRFLPFRKDLAFSTDLPKDA